MRVYFTSIIHIIMNLILFADCSRVSVDTKVPSNLGTVTITYSTSQLIPVHSEANMAVLYIWSPTDFTLSLSDNTLSRVNGWRDVSCDTTTPFVYQTARVLATALFTSGNDNFTANVVDIIINNVS